MARRKLTGLGRLAAVAALLGALLLPAQASATASGIRGRVMDATCFGPCTPGTEPRPYQGEDATVRVRRVSDGELVAFLRPDEKARFGVFLPPDTYRVVVRIENPLYEEDAEKVSVEKGEIERVRLYVVNSAIR